MRLFGLNRWALLLCAVGAALCLSCAGAKTKASEPCSCGVKDAEEEEDAPSEAWKYIEIANENLQRRKFDVVIENASKAIGMNPPKEAAGPAYVLRAAGFFEKGEYDKSIADYTEAIKLLEDDDRLALTHNLRAVSHLLKADYDAVIEDASEAIKLDEGGEEGTVAYNLRVEAYIATRRFDEAVDDASKVIQRIGVGEEAAEALAYRSIAYAEKGDSARAEEDFSAALKMEQRNARIYNQRAWTYAYHLKKDFDRAIDDVNKAIESEPEEGNYYDTRGWAYFGKGDYDNAEKDFTKALKFNKNLYGSIDGLQKVKEARAAKAEPEPEGDK